MKYIFSNKTAALFGAAILLVTAAGNVQAQRLTSILGNLGSPITVSTVPSNGDVNPYGVAIVPRRFPQGGMLKPGDILVSNFNNSANLQGTGTTIVKIEGSTPSLFFQGTAPLGLSTGLAVLEKGLVLVGNLPTKDGTSATAQPGSLIAMDSNANVVWTYSSPELVNGPWDFTVNDRGDFVQVFISNVLNGTITRLDLEVTPQQINVERGLEISSGYGFRGDPAALEVGPTGLAYDATRDILYVSSSLDNAIYAVPNAGSITANGGMGYRIYQDNQHLHGALAMILAPNGHLIVSNNDVVNPDGNQPSELVEFTVYGQFVAELPVDPAQGGAFGLGAAVMDGSLVFAAVDDNTSSLEILDFTVRQVADGASQTNTAWMLMASRPFLIGYCYCTS